MIPPLRHQAPPGSDNPRLGYVEAFEARGGELISRKINDLQELSGFDVIVNCTGQGGKGRVR